MTRKEKIAEITKLITAMGKNDYLIPVSWSDTRHFQNPEWEYTTYKADPRCPKYVCVRVKTKEHGQFEVRLSNGQMNVTMSVDTPVSIDIILDWVKKIRTDKDSQKFDISQKKSRIKKLKKELTVIENEIVHLSEDVEDMEKAEKGAQW